VNEFSTKLIAAITKHWEIYIGNKQVDLQLMQSQEKKNG